MQNYPAHIRSETQENRQIDIVQTVGEHCRNTARYAGGALEGIGLKTAGELAGLLHDLGKYTDKFSQYIWDSHRGKETQRGSVNHSFAGVQYLLGCHHGDPAAQLPCELLAYAVAAHHGLFDLMRERKEYGFPHRMETRDNGYEEAFRNFTRECADEEELNRLFEEASQELNALLAKICGEARKSPENSRTCLSFYTGLLARLLLSAVIEGDRRDTAEFQYGFRFPELHQDRNRLWQESLAYLEKKLGEFDCSTPIQKARAEISAQCVWASSRSGGIYRLNVPTGGGKTLASLRFALGHGAAHQDIRRIFFVMPLLSIIDQNSQVIRDYLPYPDMVLEHHSNVERVERQEGEKLDPRELLAENWSAPVIITTLVQLLYTLFLGKTTAVRRFQALANSIIVFDEVQTVPIHMLSLFNLAISFLTEFCGTTVVLCSATQPSLETLRYPLCREAKDLVPYREALWKPFRRTEMRNAGSCPLSEIPPRLTELLHRRKSLLVVCNKKNEAAYLYGEMKGKAEHIFHLSASMCMAHRRAVLKELEELLSSTEDVGRILCISTQVIEAGVDISFGGVVRLLAGMDSAVQSAGRCNRHGESPGAAPVYLLHCADEDLSHLGDIRMAQTASLALLQAYEQAPSAFGEDLASDKAIAYYYHTLYRQYAAELGENAMDYPLPKQGSSILDLLSLNTTQTAGLGQHEYWLWQSFQTAGEAFQVFESDTVDVLVPYGKGKEIIEDLCSARAAWDLKFVKETLERAKPFTLSLYRWQYEKLHQDHALHPASAGNALYLDGAHYDEGIGFVMDPQFSEVKLCVIPIL